MTFIISIIVIAIIFKIFDDSETIGEALWKLFKIFGIALIIALTLIFIVLLLGS